MEWRRVRVLRRQRQRGRKRTWEWRGSACRGQLRVRQLSTSPFWIWCLPPLEISSNISEPSHVPCSPDCSWTRLRWHITHLWPCPLEPLPGMFASWGWRKWFISLVANATGSGAGGGHVSCHMEEAVWRKEGREERQSWLLSRPRLPVAQLPFLVSWTFQGHSSFVPPSLGWVSITWSNNNKTPWLMQWSQERRYTRSYRAAWVVTPWHQSDGWDHRSCLGSIARGPSHGGASVLKRSCMPSPLHCLS